ncbi:MAG: arginase [Thermoleophilaceae bacterium]|nr:arginase [Thermoleophilaceae bacterium]
MERTLTPVGMLCRISEHYPTAVRELVEALGVEARFIGASEEPRQQHWNEALVENRGCLLEAGGQVDDALAAGNFPLLIAGDCAIALTTLAAVGRHRPDARVLWLDTHGDFNTPETTQSDFLGGMALAGAVGLWDAGVAAPFPAERVVLAGVAELEAPERENIERSGATVVGAGLDTLVAVQNALDGAPVYVHFDSDVLESIRAEKLYDLLEAVADESEIVGVQVNIEPEYLQGTAGSLEPLLKETHVHN